MLALLIAVIVRPALIQARNLNVFAAASLKESFTILARRYEATHPGLTIKLNFAGSQTLAAQINNGAPADVFASAAEKNLRDISFDRGSYRVFAINKLEIAVRRGVGGVASAKDLAKVRNLVVADPAVPVGQYTEAFFSNAQTEYGNQWLRAVRSHIVSRETDVKSVLAKVLIGEADAGIVYVSDVVSARGKVVGVPIPYKLNQFAEYPVGVPTRAENKEDAKHFIKSLMDPDSQRTFGMGGFIPITTSNGLIILSSAVGMGKGSLFFHLPLASRYARAVVHVTNERKRQMTYKGVLVSSLLPHFKVTQATFIGADHYAQTVPIAELKSRQAVLVWSGDGNYQLIVPGLKPSVWVNWLRSIELR